MKKINFGILLVFILFLVFSCGCGENGGLSLSNRSPSTKTTVTTIPTPAYGSLMIISRPYGAAVYIENEYKGIAPMNVSDLPVGKYNISLKMDLYSVSNFTAVVTGGQVTTVTRSLTETKPKIEVKLTNATVNEIPPCVWTFVGTITNSGDERLEDMMLTVDMKPAKRGFETVSKEIEFGALNADSSRPFGFQMTVLCEGEYKATIKWTGMERNNPTLASDDRKMSGSYTI